MQVGKLRSEVEPALAWSLRWPRERTRGTGHPSSAFGMFCSGLQDENCCRSQCRVTLSDLLNLSEHPAGKGKNGLSHGCVCGSWNKAASVSPQLGAWSPGRPQLPPGSPTEALTDIQYRWPCSPQTFAEHPLGTSQARTHLPHETDEFRAVPKPKGPFRVVRVILSDRVARSGVGRRRAATCFRGFVGPRPRPLVTSCLWLLPCFEGGVTSSCRPRRPRAESRGCPVLYSKVRQPRPGVMLAHASACPTAVGPGSVTGGKAGRAPTRSGNPSGRPPWPAPWTARVWAPPGRPGAGMAPRGAPHVTFGLLGARLCPT